MLYVIDSSELNDNSNMLIVFLLDPHHLVFPIEDKIKKLKKEPSYE